MREIHYEQIKDAVRDCVIKANVELPGDILEALILARERESTDLGRKILTVILDNAQMAVRDRMALCQDTGMVTVVIDMGQDVHIAGGDINDAVNEGVKEGYRDGYFRRSVVSDPLVRINSGDNTPAVIHYQISSGDGFRISVFPKGAGSENMGQVAMLIPSQGLSGVCEFVVKVVREAGANACPPLIVGVGLGGNMEKAAYMAKRALLRPVDVRHRNPVFAGLEEKLLGLVNQLGIGPQGMGGRTTALAVNVETYPTHIASLPVAVSLGCHATRRSLCQL